MGFAESSLLLLALWGPGPGSPSLVYQREVSEQCRRRALPSVFLGKRIVDTNAQMMHFSRLELPYSCFIAVRAETGTHIILVVQLMLGDNLESSCKNDGDQLLVYEMGETFGGYWGQVPMEYVKRTATDLPIDQTAPSAYHTLKTTRKTLRPTEPSTTPELSLVEPTTAPRVPSPGAPASVPQRVWTDVVPLLNLSLQLLPSDTEARPRFESDDFFDAFYDVTPVAGVAYQTSIVPLIQFSMSGLKDERRDGGGGGEGGRGRVGLFDLVYSSDDKFIPGKRGRQPTFAYSSAQSQQRKQLSNKLLNKFQYNQNQLSSNDISTDVTARKDTTGRDYWLHVIDLMNILKNRSNISDVQFNETNGKQSELLRKISQMEHNTSVYLEEDLDSYIKKHEIKMEHTGDPQLNNTTIKQMILTKPRYFFPRETKAVDPPSTNQYSVTQRDIFEMTSLASQNISSTSEKYVITTDVLTNLNAASSMRNHLSGKGERTTIAEMESHTPKRVASSNGSTIALKPITGALVSHESWDNIVNVAPKMAMVLNNTNHSLKHNESRSNRRNKREVQAVDVHKSRPHAWVKRLSTAVAPNLYSETDMYGFMPIAEPRDDEIYGRIHLRYVRRFIGPAIFNLCNYTHDEPKVRQVLLFNTSRILIGISNFTIKRMTLVATSARTLDSVTARCPTNHLECQVSGARVCIDSSSACDGVPNCGAHDIYDEDRLTCGPGRGLHSNVYLASFTFLAVLMTACYSVHYWLKRCVPKVSEAFFIYTNGAENILYLDSIMKSPKETDDLSKMFYQGPILEEYLRESTNRRSAMRRLINRISVFFQRKPDAKLDNQKRESRIKNTYSFMELELNKFSFKITTDTSTQIGESLEMGTFAQEQNKRPKQKPIKVRQNSLEVIEERDNVSELIEVASIMEPMRGLRAIKPFKFLREARGSVETAGLASERSASDERELGNLLYDISESMKESFSSLTVAYDPGDIATRSQLQTATQSPGPSNTKKCLRFEEAATVIPSANCEADYPLQSKQSLVPGARGSEPSGEESGMDFMRFWSIKPKKTKNKSHVSMKK